MSKEFDIVLWGATGFTGKYCANYLAKYYPPGGEGGLKWAIAGRNQGKLEVIKEDLLKTSPSCKVVRH